MIERYSRPQMKEVWSERNKYEKWLQVELAACEAWHKEGLIPSDEMIKLRSAAVNFEDIQEALKETRHELAAFLGSVTGSLGKEGRWVHQGLTTSDVWDTATSLQIVEALDIIDSEIASLLDALKVRAIEHKDTLIMGRTHGIHAEPTTFGLKLAIWWDETNRNRERISSARRSIAYGKISGPVGTHATAPPSIEAHVCDSLGLEPAPVSNQVIQRDRHAQFVTTLAIVAASLEKFATEIRGLQRTEIGEVQESFPEGQAGSSSMPHKRNPELSERVCGLSRLIRGHAVTALENVALWGERDISHSSSERVILPDACLALDYILNLFTGVIRDLHVDSDRMFENIESTRGVLFSQRVLLALVENGAPRDEAYSVVHTEAMKSWDNKSDFRDLIRSNDYVSSCLSSVNIDELFDYRFYTRYVDEIFSRVGLE